MADDIPLADVLRRTIYDAQDLVRGEIALARAELRQEFRRLRAGAVALASGALAALLAVVFLLTAAAWGLADGLDWPVWGGFAVVGAVLAVIGALLLVSARRRLTRERHMQLTVDTIKENAQWMQGRSS